MIKRLQKLILKNKTELLVIILIVTLAAFMRLYKISEYMTFLGDEGRDVIIAKEILSGDFTLLGPRASAGDFFLGPAYYYMIAPFLFLAGYDPVGPAIMIAIFGILSVALVYYVSRKFFGIKAAIIAASLYAISPLVIAYSRSSWNPNLMPFLSLLIFYLMYLSLKKQSLKLFVVVGFLIGIALQSHYLTVFVGVIAFVYLILGEFLISRKEVLKRGILHGLAMLAGFIAGISPFLFFELRHGFPNLRTIFRFVFVDNSSDTYTKGQSFLSNIGDVAFRLFGRLVMKFPPPEQVNVSENLDLRLWQIATIILAILSVVAVVKVKDRLAKLLLIIWLAIGILLFGIYKKPIYDYYLGFLFPLPFLFVGNFLSQVSELKKYRKASYVVSAIVFLSLVVFNLSGMPFLSPPNKQKDQAKNIAEFILSKTDSRPYNFALITKGNSDHVYRYFLEIEDRAPVAILNFIDDPERKSVTDQLIVVCDYPDCQPLGNPLWEVAGFGRAEIVGEWDVPFVKIYKLVHYYRPEGFRIENSDLNSTYENNEYGFSFEYPDTFTFKNLTSGKLAKELNHDLSIELTTPDVLKERKLEPGFDFNEYSDNTMRINIALKSNEKSMGLLELIENRYQYMSADGRTDDSGAIREDLDAIDVPKSGSFVYEGLAERGPFQKAYFFLNQNTYYEISLFGGTDSDPKYTREMEELFDNITESFKFE